MKKLILLIFVAISCFIFYQMILGENGVVEGYRIQKEKERINFYKNLLLKQKNELDIYIQYLKTNPDAYKTLAEKLGFFAGDNNLIKVIEQTRDSSNDFVYEEDLENTKDINKKIFEYEKKYKINDKINNLRTIISIIFFIFFGFFLLIIILGGEKDDRNYKNR